ncbi:MAG: arginine--tRNA ligase [Candidatus Bathyarchaeota archaeon]|nr:arginine--tRNA ligase [Candidatus Bathyarchaeota archaeon]
MLISENPFNVFHQECENSLRKALEKLYPETQLAELSLKKPPNPEFGQLASSLCFDLAKKNGKNPIVLAKQLAKNLDKTRFSLVKHVDPAGAGYINFHLDFAKFSGLTIESARHFDAEYGFVKTSTPMRIIVEHTSANPLHPLHIGQARNPVLGDTLARMLKSRGHTVFRHFYIDDVGRQSSVVAYGYAKLGKPEPDEKPDHFIGKIYTITSCIVEIARLKKELEQAKQASSTEALQKINKELDEWVAVAADLQQRFSELFRKLHDEISKEENPERAINLINQAYETQDKKAIELSRHVTDLCLEGFKQTLSRIDITHDSWDWESSFVWSGHVADVLQKLKSSPYVSKIGGILEFEAGKIVEDLGLKPKLGLRESYEVPSLTLVRSDGTTLYTTRDLAYTLWKFEKADRVINVIGMEQNLAQLQLKIGLYALGRRECAENLVHFAYNLVSLPSSKAQVRSERISSRMGRYITFDEVMDEAVRRAFEEVSKRSAELSEKEKKRIAEFVGIGAVRYALVAVDPQKPVVFTWDRVLDFEKNSAPYIQYTHARACSILRKAARAPEKPDYSLLTEKLEQEIVLALAEFPDTFVEATEFLKPSAIAEFAVLLADKFNTFYNALPVIKAEPPQLSDARLALVDAVRIVLRNALSVIGIVAPERM